MMKMGKVVQQSCGFRFTLNKPSFRTSQRPSREGFRGHQAKAHLNPTLCVQACGHASLKTKMRIGSCVLLFYHFASFSKLNVLEHSKGRTSNTEGNENRRNVKCPTKECEDSKRRKKRRKKKKGRFSGILEGGKRNERFFGNRTRGVEPTKEWSRRRDRR